MGDQGWLAVQNSVIKKTKIVCPLHWWSVKKRAEKGRFFKTKNKHIKKVKSWIFIAYSNSEFPAFSWNKLAF
jgi:hypothetical protein